MNAVEKLREITDTLLAATGPAADSWALAVRLLSRMPTDQKRASEVVAARDAAALDAIVSAIEHPAAPEAASTPAAGAVAHTHDDLNAALRAFRKRLKLARLEDESKLGGRQMTAGRASLIRGIIAPREFPKEIWDAHVAEGRLKYTGQGFYALPDDPADHVKPV